MEKEGPVFVSDTHYDEVAKLTPEQWAALRSMQFNPEPGDVIKAIDPVAVVKKPKSKRHPWLHPTKGWRMFSRPSKAKPGGRRRRKLIPQGRLMLFGSDVFKPMRIKHPQLSAAQRRAAIAALVEAGLPLGASHNGPPIRANVIAHGSLMGAGEYARRPFISTMD